MSNIRVLLAEDHTIVRKGLRSLLDAEVNIEVVGEADDGRQAIQKAQQFQPDVVLMDITMPVLNGLEATRQIKKLLPQIRVLVLTVHTSEEYIFQILQAGAAGYVVKQAAVEELIAAIMAVSQGNAFISPSVPENIIEEYSRQMNGMTAKDNYARLTDREREVLQLVAEGRSNREIAQMLHITTKTVEAHRSRVMEKLNIRSTADLTRYAIRRGIIAVEQK
ncbi:MAG: response regulator transcription factor [Chloroflexales bacterium]|jgi:RNA polymerase sigma factor (sigma-70 family)